MLLNWRNTVIPSKSKKKSTKPIIGRLNESSLHANLKKIYAGKEGAIEVPTERWICDVRQSDGSVVEIQTSGFSALYNKVKELSLYTPVLIVHPIAVDTWLHTYNTDGKLLSKRKSPKHGLWWNIFDELIYAPKLPLLKHCSIEVLLLSVEEIRVADGKGARRRRGVRIEDKKILKIHRRVLFKNTEDWKACVPQKLKEERFNSQSFSKETGISRKLSQKVLYVLAKIGIIIEEGREGRYKTYSFCASKT